MLRLSTLRDSILANYEDEQITLRYDDKPAETRTVKRPKVTPVFHAFVIRSDRPDQQWFVWVQLGPADPIENAVAQWREEFTGNDRNRSLGTTSRPVVADNGLFPKQPSAPDAILHQLVWDKLAPHLDGCHTVIILPDGALHRVPSAALPGRKPGSYLLEDYALSTATYGQQLFGLLTDQPVPTTGQLLVAGGIQYDQRGEHGASSREKDSLQSAARSLDLANADRNWPHLNGAEEEAQTVQKLWGQRGHVQVLSNTAADERAIAEALPNARFAHLATHGFFDTAAEVYRVNLRQQGLFQTSLGGNRRGATVAAQSAIDDRHRAGRGESGARER